MSGNAVFITKVALATGLISVVLGAVTAIRDRPLLPQSALPWLRRRPKRQVVNWRRFGAGQVLFGIYVLIETVPRVADASAHLIFVCSLVAFVPLAASLTLNVTSAKRAGTTM
jgi:hypothetical protein